VLLCLVAMLSVRALLLVSLALSGANAHVWWDVPAAGAYPSQVQPLKTLCGTRNNTAAPTTMGATAGGPFQYGVRINAHGGGQFKATWFPATAGGLGSYTFGVGVDMTITPATTNFTNVTTAATVVGTCPAGVTGEAMVQLAAETVMNGAYIACRWASAGSPSASTGIVGTTTGVAVATTGAARTGASTTGVATTSASTAGVATTGAATTGTATTGVVTAGAATTGVGTTGVGTTGTTGTTGTAIQARRAAAGAGMCEASVSTLLLAVGLAIIPRNA
jgi:hypothetical protein